jgi:hypothetical protein
MSKKNPKVCPQLTYHVLLITNVFVNRIAKPLLVGGIQGGAQGGKTLQLEGDEEGFTA